MGKYTAFREDRGDVDGGASALKATDLALCGGCLTTTVLTSWVQGLGFCLILESPPQALKAKTNNKTHHGGLES